MVTRNHAKPSIAVGTPPTREYGLERTAEQPKKPLRAKGQAPTGVIRASQVRYADTITPAKARADEARESVLFRLDFLTC